MRAFGATSIRAVIGAEFGWGVAGPASGATDTVQAVQQPEGQ